VQQREAERDDREQQRRGHQPAEPVGRAAPDRAAAPALSLSGGDHQARVAPAAAPAIPSGDGFQ
jgi:hypothetical protein